MHHEYRADYIYEGTRVPASGSVIAVARARNAHYEGANK